MKKPPRSFQSALKQQEPYLNRRIAQNSGLQREPSGSIPSVSMRAKDGLYTNAQLRILATTRYPLTSVAAACPGDIAVSNARNAVCTFFEVALFESDIFPVVDDQRRSVVVLFEPEAAV